MKKYDELNLGNFFYTFDKTFITNVLRFENFATKTKFN